MNKHEKPVREVCHGTDVPLTFSLEGVTDEIKLNECFVRAEAIAGGKKAEFNPQDTDYLRDGSSFYLYHFISLFLLESLSIIRPQLHPC